MRKLYLVTLLSCVLAVVCKAAGNGTDVNNASRTGKGGAEFRIHAVDLGRFVANPDNARSRRQKALQAKAAGQNAATPHRTMRLADINEVNRLAATADMERLDSVVCTTDQTGTEEKYSLQTFEFDANGWPVKRVNSLYDTGSRAYVPVEVYEFKWNEDGLCESQLAYSDVYQSGERRDYVYNEQGLGIEQTVYTYSPAGADKWVPSWKGVYKYDGRGNIIEEQLSTYNAADATWALATMNRAAWDEQGMQTLFEPYSWNGTEWTGIDEKQEYTWIDKDHMTLCNSYIWDTQAKAWMHYVILENDFDDRLNLLRREKMFYNKTLGNWAGCETYNGSYYENEKSILTYDEKGRKLTERAYGAPTTDGYILGAGTDYVWTELPDGGCQAEYVGWLGESKEDNISYTGIERYDAAGNQTYVLDNMYNYTTGSILHDYERTSTFNENNDILTEITYTFTADAENRRQPDLAVYNTYDEHYNIIETVNQTGSLGGGIPFGALSSGTAGDEDVEWQNSTRFVYVYENDTVRIDKQKYMWKNDEWTLSERYSDEYEYTVPVENIVAWPGFNAYHKLMQTTSSVLSGNVLVSNVFKYHYSDFSTSGISGTVAGGSVRVYPRVVESGFNVEATAGARVRVYSMSGACVATSDQSWVSVEGLPAGVYVVNVEGHNIKIVKR